MNTVALKGMLKLVKNMISPDQIKEAANSLVNSAIDFKNGVPLDIDNSEVAVTGIVYELAGTVYCGLAILNCQNHIVRFENIRPLDEVIENLIEKM